MRFNYKNFSKEVTPFLLKRLTVFALVLGVLLLTMRALDLEDLMIPVLIVWIAVGLSRGIYEAWLVMSDVLNKKEPSVADFQEGLQKFNDKLKEADQYSYHLEVPKEHTRRLRRYMSDDTGTIFLTTMEPENAIFHFLLLDHYNVAKRYLELLENESAEKL